MRGAECEALPKSSTLSLETSDDDEFHAAWLSALGTAGIEEDSPMRGRFRSPNWLMLEPNWYGDGYPTAGFCGTPSYSCVALTL